MEEKSLNYREMDAIKGGAHWIIWPNGDKIWINEGMPIPHPPIIEAK